MPRTRYPYWDANVQVLGPEIFASEDRETISWRGENYVKQSRLAKSDTKTFPPITLKRGDSLQVTYHAVEDIVVEGAIFLIKGRPSKTYKIIATEIVAVVESNDE